ncbi:hypothetical protein JKF63_06877 [Porcisia hertigi]|uniref:O-phosphoseryl-tRNA(Sec) selenium transferase n=1 Tax=Porcisia hertigi TaxID=2761500 RepID=A0A836LJA4_9TRYP|nr:hypothetical protein JKF63_06877 [Porcisia hertigi]
MDDRSLKLAEELVSARYIDAGRESLQSTARILRSILAQRCCPNEGLNDATIELILRQLALMDTNNFAHHVGGGEREGRVVSELVRQRHFHLSHGIGRSGDLVSDQPKAAGSSLLYKVTNVLMLDLIRLAGARSTAAAVVVPMATGMTLALVLQCVAKRRMRELTGSGDVQLQRAATQKLAKETPAAQAQEPQISEDGRVGSDHVPLPVPTTPRFVIWPRIDQKTALKCIDVAGLVPVPVQLRPAPPFARTAAASISSKGGSLNLSPADIASPPMPSSSPFLECYLDDVAAAVEAVGGPSQVVCVLSTTSCFAPRLPDNTVAIAQYCKRTGIPYVVNNAYGVQSRRIMTRLDAAQRLGRVDFVVQSGDKNFLVPVGGSIICSSDKKYCEAAAALYAGRASMSPIVDLFITALSLGRRGMQALWNDRYKCRSRLIRKLRVFAHERGEALLVDDSEDERDDEEEDMTGGSPRSSNDVLPRNDISIAVTMRMYGLPAAEASSSDALVDSEEGEKGATNWLAARALGAQLFRSGVTGPRVITPAPSTPTTIAGCTFQNYGMHQDGRPPCPLLVIACGLGMSESEVDALMSRLRDVWPVPT